MPAAGIAGFIKTALSMYNKQIIPTLHCEEPNDIIDKTCFRLVKDLDDWTNGSYPRVAGVNAFGFGGTNVHVVLEEAVNKSGNVKAPGIPVKKDVKQFEDILIVSGTSGDELLEAVENNKSKIGDGNHRLVIFQPDEKKLKRAKKIIERGKPWRGRGDIFYSTKGLSTDGGKIAFLFPGVDSSFQPRVEDVAEHFGIPEPAFTKPKDLEETGLGIVEMNSFMDSLLNDLGVKPDSVAGHSVGEWSAMIAAGIITRNELEKFKLTLSAGALEIPDAVFVAAGCGADRAGEALKGLPDISISNDNCLHQVILCGKEGSVDTALQRLKKDGVMCQKLPFKSGFHSPIYAEFLNQHRKNFETITFKKPRIPIWSATTVSHYPEAISDMKKLAIDHLIKPVRFRELIDKLYEDGTRIFIQPGTGSLMGFVDDVLSGREFATVSTNVAKRSGMEQLRRTAAALFIEGVDIDLDKLSLLPEDQSAPIVQNTPAAVHEMDLVLGVPLINLDENIKIQVPGTKQTAYTPVKGNHPVIDAYNESMEDVAGLQQEVFQEWQNSISDTKQVKRAPVKQTTVKQTAVKQKSIKETLKKIFDVKISLETFPELIDHSLFPQHKDCTSVADKGPVVPMTMSISLLRDYAVELLPQKKAIAIENIQALKWIEISNPLDAKIEAEYDGDSKVKVTIQGYLTGNVIVADEFPPVPEPVDFQLKEEKDCPITPKELYDEGYMFHGPDYQGVTELGPMGSNGIIGKITAPKGKGSLLDNAGQLFGFWVMLYSKEDQLAMPIRIDRIEFFAEDPEIGKVSECVVMIRPLEGKTASADIELAHNGKVWTTITGWHDRRFDTDDRLFSMMRKAGIVMLSDYDPAGYMIYKDHYTTANSRSVLKDVSSSISISSAHSSPIMVLIICAVFSRTSSFVFNISFPSNL